MDKDILVAIIGVTFMAGLGVGFLATTSSSPSYEDTFDCGRLSQLFGVDDCNDLIMVFEDFDAKQLVVCPYPLHAGHIRIYLENLDKSYDFDLACQTNQFFVINTTE